MSDPLTAGTIATLIFTTAVGKLTEALTEDARKQLTQKLQSLKELIGSKFQGKAKAALARADRGDETDKDTVTKYLGMAMAEDPAFAQQVRALANDIEQVIKIDQVQGQNVQNVFGGEANQVNNPQGPVIMGGSGNTININT
ncbi:MAG: hypothetical protein AAF572_28285 [Cyanobacteria bacterium P01_B01_bin.77]